MINKLTVKNFKCFKKQEFFLSPLSIFCGANSAGKSTAIQAILSIKQNKENIENGYMYTYGDLFNFGKVSDLFCHNADSSEFEITIDDAVIQSNITIKEKQNYTIPLSNKVENLNNKFVGDFVYLCAERFGPRASYDVKRRDDKLDIGIYGQYALSEYSKIEGKPSVNPKFSRLVCSHLIESSTDKEQAIFANVLVREAMKKIYPNFNMKVSEAENIDKVYHLYESSTGKDFVRPNNAGFGISYTLPIVIAAAAIKPGGILIVENPEVHLHPQAQSQLIALLSCLSQCDVQVIIETHSDHIVNGVRVFAKENSVATEHSIIYSISEMEQERVAKEIRIDSDGNFTDLDIGFFDQINNDLMKLF